MADLAKLITILDEQRANAEDSHTRALIDAAIATLTQAVPAQLDGDAGQDQAASERRRHQVNIHDQTQVGLAISGDVDDLQSGGARYEAFFQIFFQVGYTERLQHEHREALAAYLESIARHHDRLRLAGIVNAAHK